MAAEFLGGWWFGSLALLADAGHMLSDVASVALSLFAIWIAARPATPRRSFGYYRAEILAALVQGATLVIAAVLIIIEAWHRWEGEHSINGPGMMAIAAGGLAINVASLFVLHPSRDENLNLRGAWLHVMFDALGSIAAIVAAVLIWAFGWTWADATASVLIALLVVASSLRLLNESTAILMEGAPHGLDLEAVRAAMREVEGVTAVHDLHVWSITTGMDALCAHVVVQQESLRQRILREIRQRLHDRFGIHLSTIQIETDAECAE